jgi:hypothetical protein
VPCSSCKTTSLAGSTACMTSPNPNRSRQATTTACRERSTGGQTVPGHRVRQDGHQTLPVFYNSCSCGRRGRIAHEVKNYILSVNAIKGVRPESHVRIFSPSSTTPFSWCRDVQPNRFREFNEDEYRKFIRTLSDEELIKAGKRLRILCGDVVTPTPSTLDWMNQKNPKQQKHGSLSSFYIGERLCAFAGTIVAVTSCLLCAS